MTSGKQHTATIVIIFILGLFLICLMSLLLFHFHQMSVRKLAVDGASDQATASAALLYGSNIDISQLLPTSPYYIKNSKGEDLIDVSHRLGITMLRISSVLQSFSYQTPDVIYTKAQWDMVLNKMASKGVKAMIIAETHTSTIDQTASPDAITNGFLLQVKKYVIDSNVGDNPDVYAFDMKNEPVLTDSNLAILRQEGAMLKKRYPHVSLTVGGWRGYTGIKDGSGRPVYRWNEPQDAALLHGIVDFYSPHIYGFDRKVNGQFPDGVALVTNYLHTLEAVDSTKPILISEFGASNGDSVSDMGLIGSKELQANTYYDMYTVLNHTSYKNILGSIGYVLYSRNQYPDSWSILKDRGDYIYPAGYVLQKFSLGKSDVVVNVPFISVPNDIMLSNKDYRVTNTAKVGDIVSMSIAIDKKNQYQLVITPLNAVTMVENFTYIPQFGQFFAVFSPTAAGPIHISINLIPQCGTPVSCPPYSIYTTDLSVQ